MSNSYRRWLYALVVLLTLIAALYLSGWVYSVLQTCGTIVGLYFAAWLLQLFFTPFVDFLSRRGVPRVIGVTSVYLALIIIVVIVIAAAAPAIYNQGQHLARSLQNTKSYEIISHTTRAVETFLIQRLHVPPKDINDFTRNYSVNLSKGAVNAGKKLQGLISTDLNPAIFGNSTSAFVALLNTVQSFLLNFVIVLILAFYMTLDGHKLARSALSYCPPAVGEVMQSINVTVNRKFGGYLRGQIILAGSYALLTYIIATGFSLQYALVIALFAAVMMLIPFIGTFAAVIPPIITYILLHVSNFSFGHFLLLLAFLIGTQQVVINFLSPRVMGSAVGMHPLLVVLGLLLGAKIAGLWGAIFGVPVFGVMMETTDLLYRRTMDRRYGFHPPHLADFPDDVRDVSLDESDEGQEPREADRKKETTRGDGPTSGPTSGPQE